MMDALHTVVGAIAFCAFCAWLARRVYRALDVGRMPLHGFLLGSAWYVGVGFFQVMWRLVVVMAAVALAPFVIPVVGLLALGCWPLALAGNPYRRRCR